MQPRERLELALGIGIERDPADTVVGDADEEIADRRAGHHVVGHVEQSLGSSGCAKAGVELGRNGVGHVVSFRSRRTPAEAACRAAASVEPSAAPISS